MIHLHTRLALCFLVTFAWSCSSENTPESQDDDPTTTTGDAGGTHLPDTDAGGGKDAANPGTGTSDGAVRSDAGELANDAAAEDSSVADASSHAGVDGSSCGQGSDCLNAHCVSEVCCASACDAPAECQTAVGATCSGGTTCVYANADDGTSCDDESVCTDPDKCQNGECTGPAADCDDDNPCTVESCDPIDGCKSDGTGVTIKCADDDLCASGYVCQGDSDGSCLPSGRTDCSDTGDDCNLGYCDDADGQCKQSPFATGLSCDDGNVCTSGETCTTGSCGAGTASVCNDNNPCTDEMCDAQLGCVSTPNSVACNDGNPCTVSDTCSGGECKQSSPRNCDDSKLCTSDSCNAATLAGDPCVHTNNMVSCNDNDSCTAVDACSGGSCTGSGNACGANATACSTGTPNSCTCTFGFLDNGAGGCVPNLDECVAANPCAANATCNDPSSTLGNAQCACKVGFSGDGRVTGSGCADIDECAGNPCGAGRGTCSQPVPGQYSCACADGFAQVGGSCVCDLNGTFALRVAATITWSGIANIQDAGTTKPVVYSWALRQHTYDSAGKLHVVTTPCGGTGADLCGSGNIFVAPEAYSQFLPVHIWGTSGVPTETVDMTLANALPGAAFVTQPSATLFGISLQNPMGAWPSARTQVGTGTSQVNGALWLDHDADNKPGVTSYSVPPGGYPVDGIAPDPMTAYPATSTACPRGNASAARLAYNYWPGVEGFALRRTRRFYVGSRTIGYFDGSITSCNVISGSIKGPANGQMQNDGRIQGCVRTSDTGETDCSDTLTDFYDTADQSAQQVQSASFVIKRVASNATCADVRGASY